MPAGTIGMSETILLSELLELSADKLSSVVANKLGRYPPSYKHIFEVSDDLLASGSGQVSYFYVPRIVVHHYVVFLCP